MGRAGHRGDSDGGRARPHRPDLRQPPPRGQVAPSHDRDLN